MPTAQGSPATASHKGGVLATTRSGRIDQGWTVSQIPSTPGSLTAIRLDSYGPDQAWIALAGLTVLVSQARELHGGGRRSRSDIEHGNQESSSGTGDPPIEDASSFASALFKNSSRSGQPSNRARGYGQSTSEPSGRPRRCCLRRVRGGEHGEGAVRGHTHVRVHESVSICASAACRLRAAGTRLSTLHYDICRSRLAGKYSGAGRAVGHARD